MAYQAVLDARREAEKNQGVVREAVKLGLQMKREAEARNTASTYDDGAKTDIDAVTQFAIVMREKLAKSRLRGRGGWNDKGQCSQEHLSKLLREHVEKGDPVDVANLAMMLHQRGETIASSMVPQLGGSPEDLRNTLCAVLEIFGIEGADKVLKYVLAHRGINAFDGKPVTIAT